MTVSIGGTRDEVLDEVIAALSGDHAAVAIVNKLRGAAKAPEKRRPSFDENGYPDEATLDAIEHWPHTDTAGLVAFARAAFDEDYGRWSHTTRIDSDGKEIPCLEIATGGWSGNESVVSALRQNHVFHGLYWESSHRGGLHVYNYPAAR